MPIGRLGYSATLENYAGWLITLKLRLIRGCSIHSLFCCLLRTAFAINFSHKLENTLQGNFDEFNSKKLNNAKILKMKHMEHVSVIKINEALPTTCHRY
jgi:hypothetical protein